MASFRLLTLELLTFTGGYLLFLNLQYLDLYFINFQNTRFIKIYNLEEISYYLKFSISTSQTEFTNFGLRELAFFIIFQQSWVADNKFIIIQDIMDFNNYKIKEVELFSSICTIEEERALRLEKIDF
ncbi:uncharacterized protein BO88DRAFT_427252 [Aspergillus vadensis CBS 113365]|uniref:Uncharacterized protein n=1 Tax=Aspergillus vadensis (strain CBS 113365 / IMI 142717 / IBT 24658) TaxID=1448311 RepID=A0A319B595_ASPVC|nr:hypothetical protein BO88DRAFT_427252 [Aspergillus vadensis CBS 113365]PYH67061.1 hypothetical protein BO88DRAFT_427252 [Aspergillus vadensis CBS 113365]